MSQDCFLAILICVKILVSVIHHNSDKCNEWAFYAVNLLSKVP